MGIRCFYTHQLGNLPGFYRTYLPVEIHHVLPPIPLQLRKRHDQCPDGQPDLYCSGRNRQTSLRRIFHRIHYREQTRWLLPTDQLLLEHRNQRSKQYYQQPLARNIQRGHFRRKRKNHYLPLYSGMRLINPMLPLENSEINKKNTQ